MQIANYVTPNIFIIVQKWPKSLAAGAPPQTPPGGAYSAPPDPLAALGWDGDFKTLYPPSRNPGYAPVSDTEILLHWNLKKNTRLCYQRIILLALPKFFESKSGWHCAMPNYC